MKSDESRWARIRPRTITIDGDRVAYRAAGKGPVLLLVHGVAGNSLTWRYVMRAVEASGRGFPQMRRLSEEWNGWRTVSSRQWRQKRLFHQA
jgi:pimeloyl-ACP methyl ester carboxylesterase